MHQDELCLGTFIRVRVIIDISKPLKRILNVRLGTGKELVTILLKYEHLPELCFHCGLLGHPLKECPERGALQGDILKLKYGAWIKAPIPSSGKSTLQNKRRRPSSGLASHALPHGNPTNSQPHASTSKTRQKPLPNRQHNERPNPLHPLPLISLHQHRRRDRKPNRLVGTDSYHVGPPS